MATTVTVTVTAVITVTVTVIESIYGTGTLDVSSPVSYQVIQRDESSLGDIVISGTYTGTPGPIEASFNGGEYAQICTTPSGGTFLGTLTGQTAGQGALSVRWVGDGGNTDTVTLVGIGDIFIIAGQSNAVGYIGANQSYSHATLKACMFANDYNWKELDDPTDINTNQVDAVSNDTVVGGSYWMVMATNYLAGEGIPCAFVPCALTGTSIAVWQPGANHQDRSTLYGSMVYRALQTGCRVILWHQGESDVISEMSEVDYNNYLDTLANAIIADLGVKLMPAKLQRVYWNELFDNSAVNSAIETAWSDNSNVATGPDFSDLEPAGLHIGSVEEIQAAADRWYAACVAEFGW